MNPQMVNFIIIIMASKYREGWTQFTVLLQPRRRLTVLCANTFFSHGDSDVNQKALWMQMTLLLHTLKKELFVYYVWI